MKGKTVMSDEFSRESGREFEISMWNNENDLLKDPHFYAVELPAKSIGGIKVIEKSAYDELEDRLGKVMDDRGFLSKLLKEEENKNAELKAENERLKGLNKVADDLEIHRGKEIDSLCATVAKLRDLIDSHKRINKQLAKYAGLYLKLDAKKK